jgi:hypothetical protein
MFAKCMDVYSPKSALPKIAFLAEPTAAFAPPHLSWSMLQGRDTGGMLAGEGSQAGVAKWE